MAELTEAEVAINKLSIDHFKRVQEMRERFVRTGKPFTQEESNDNEDSVEGSNSSS